MLTTKDTNDTVCVHFTWPVQTGYTPPQGLTLTHRPVFVCRQQHRLYSNIKYWWCGRKFKKVKMMVMFTTKDTNDTVCVHFTWPVQTGYTPPQGFTLTHRPVFVCRQHHRLYTTIEYWWCGRKFKKVKMMVMFTTKDTNDTVCVHFTWPVQTGYTPPQRFTLTHRPVFVCRQQHRLYSNIKYWWCGRKFKKVKMMVMFTTKDTNDTVCVHFTWPVQTGYTPPQGFTLTHRPVFVCRQQHRLYSNIKYWWCGRKFKKVKMMVMFTTKDTNDTVCVHFTWPVQTGYTPPQGFTLTHRPVFVCRQQHRLYSNIKYWWCGRKFKKVKMMVMFTTKDTNDTVCVHFTWPVQTGYTPPQGFTLTHRLVFVCRQHHRLNL